MWYNSLAILILQSPLHSLLSGSVLLLTFTGKKSGKRYTTTVNYVRSGDLFYVISFRKRTWWRNLRGGAPVTLLLKGKEVRAIGEAIADDRQALIASLTTFLTTFPRYAKYLGVALGADGQPDAADVARAAESLVVVQIRLEQKPNASGGSTKESHDTCPR